MIPAGTYRGYALTLNGASYSCPALRLYGYATPNALESAIRRELKKRAGVRCYACHGLISEPAPYPRCQAPARHGAVS